jgi:hypothetical protein
VEKLKPKYPCPLWSGFKDGQGPREIKDKNRNIYFIGFWRKLEVIHYDNKKQGLSWLKPQGGNQLIHDIWSHIRGFKMQLNLFYLLLSKEH